MVMAERHGMKTIMVASPSGEDGKTAIAANLAVSLAQVGKRVVLLSADLRQARSTPTSVSTTSVACPTSSPARCRRGRPCRSPPGLERLWVFGSGPTPASPG